MDVDEKTMKIIVETDLKLSPLKMRTCQHLTDLRKVKKIDPSEDSSQKTERWYGHLRSHFFQKKNCSQLRPFALQKMIAFLQNQQETFLIALKVFRRLKPSSVMVWAATSKTWKSPLIFVPQGAKLNTNSYIELILTPALEEAKKHFKNMPFTFQQDEAQSHTSKKTRNGVRTISTFLE